ncbi:MAG: hypothetical protein EOO07_30735 [Chitinophagaceae bacterium]|nr:MAG: hypothetical protein EOO07_30735 [Chitinophagaceae bacterium]
MRAFLCWLANISENVKIAINYYQEDDPWLSGRQGEEIEVDKPKKTVGINIKVENTSHTKIDNDKKKEVANLILAAHKNSTERIKKEKEKEKTKQGTLLAELSRNESTPSRKN